MQEEIEKIKEFLIERMTRTNVTGYLVGLSGGIDSAVSASLAVEAVGKERVLAVLMPYKSSSAESVSDAMLLVDKLGINHHKIDISPMIDAYYPEITDEIRLRAGNKMARERMSILFDLASQLNGLVLGTGNRTEICLGYTTWFGDSACSVNPVGQLYKREIVTLAQQLGVPESIRFKAPSADLWEGQTDESEIGVRYDTIDALLERMVDVGENSLNQLEREGFAKTDIEKVVALLNRNSFKRRLPDVADLGRGIIPVNINLKD